MDVRPQRFSSPWISPVTDWHYKPFVLDKTRLALGIPQFLNCNRGGAHDNTVSQPTHNPTVDSSGSSGQHRLQKLPKDLTNLTLRNTANMTQAPWTTLWTYLLEVGYSYYRLRGARAHLSQWTRRRIHNSHARNLCPL